jgi:hypothetical protein
VRIAYWGNFSVPWCTEVHVAEAFELAGHRVVRLQEGRVTSADVRLRLEAGERWDVFVWTRTLGLALTGGSNDDQLRTVDALRAAGVPTVGVHLDRWWGLAREDQVRTDAFFRLDLVCTADGGNDEAWVSAGVAHAWMPPGVHLPECVPGRWRDDMAADVLFVGSWRGYHAEHQHRVDMLRYLRARYADRFAMWPRGDGAVRGRDLADLYASARVVVGDSCLVGTPGFTGRYCSDRVPETIGRGGLLVHPRVEGVTDGTLYSEWDHLLCWEAGDWEALGAAVDAALDSPADAAAVAEQGRRHVLSYHTYSVRVVQVLAEAAHRGLVDYELVWPAGEGILYALGNRMEGYVLDGEEHQATFDGQVLTRARFTITAPVKINRPPLVPLAIVQDETTEEGQAE